MLASALGRHACRGPLDDLQQGLLDPLAGDVAGDRRRIGLAGDLVDLVDVDDAALGLLDVVVGGLQQVEDDVFDILADVSGLGQVGGVGNGEGHVEQLRQRLGQQRLAAPGGAEQQDVALLHLDIARLGGVLDALVVIINGNGQDLLGLILADHVIVQDILDLGRPGQSRLVGLCRLFELGLFDDDVLAQVDTFVADIYGRSGNELFHFVLRFAAERTR